MMLEVQLPTDNAGGTGSSGGNGDMLAPTEVLDMAAVMKVLACWWQWWRY